MHRTDGLNPGGRDTLALDAAKRGLVSRVIDMQLNITLSSQVRHTRAALAEYGVEMAKYSAETLSDLFDNHDEDETGDVQWMTQDISGQARGLYHDILNARNEGSVLRRTADLARVSAVARGLGKSGILLTASGTSVATGAMVHQVYNHVTPTAIAFGAGYLVGKSIVPSIVRNSTHRILGQQFDQFLVPVTAETWEHYEALELARQQQGLPELSLSERAAAIRHIEIETQVSGLQEGLDAVAWNWWQTHKPPHQADPGVAAAVLSQSAINHIGETLGVVNDHTKIPITHVLALGV
ncbi:MAG: hypothetical protein KIH63_003000 [Candidatus Saccharibacteria bacterium]|nr:hypothetical protein [Candidatus Saccharibacteria bacterium]